MEYSEFRAMNSNIVLAAEGDAGRIREGFARARAAIEESEARFTRFCESSELAALNRSAGAWLSVSQPMYQLVCEARRYVDQTAGLFNPAILDALERAGYDRSMDDLRRDGVRPSAMATTPLPGDMHAIAFDAQRQAIRLPQGLRLDLGGIAKGWIAEQATHLLALYATACAVSAGGDMFVWGVPEGESAWEIGLEEPRAPEQDLAILRICGGAVATSSIVKRSWQSGEQRMHHLIDPRTGRPAQTDWLSVTVLAPHTAIAEVFAKALLIAGPREAEAIAERRGDIGYIAVDAKGTLFASPRVLPHIKGET